MVRGIPGKPRHEPERTPPTYYPALALRRGRAHLRDGAGRRRDTLDRIRAIHCRMEAGDRRAAAAERGSLAGGVRQVQGHSAIQAPQQRHDAARVQDHLLVGMDAPSDGPADRGRIPAAVLVVPNEGLDRTGPALAALDDLRARLAARRGRMVDGGLGAY